jgi:hypothetical protein
MAQALGTVHTHRRGLLRGLWLPVDPKLVTGQMAAPVTEIMDCSLYTSESPRNHFTSTTFRKSAAKISTSSTMKKSPQSENDDYTLL